MEMSAETKNSKANRSLNPVQGAFPHPALGILGVLTGGSISVLAGLLLSTGLADLRAGMRLTVDEAVWVPTAYNMVLVFIGILSVHLGAIFGHRRVLMIASLVSTLAFLLAPLAPNSFVLITLLIIAGLGTGTFYPLILGFLLPALPGQLAVFGTAVYVIDVLVPTYLGFWFEGIASNYLSWHWIFYIPALVIPLVFLFAYFGMPRTRPNYGDGEKPNFTGFLYAALGLAFLYGALDQGERLDWFESGTFSGLLLASVILLIGTVVRRFWMPNPLYRLRFLLDRNIFILGVVLVFFRLSILTYNLLIPSFLSSVAGYRPLETGHVVWFGLVPEIIVAPLVVIFLLKVDIRLLLAAGLALTAIACLMFGQINPYWSNPDFFNPIILQAAAQPVIVISLVTGILLLVLSKGAVKKPWEVATMACFFQTVRLVGGAIATAILRHFITVQSKLHTVAVSENLPAGDANTTDFFQKLAAQAAAAGGSPELTRAQASHMAGKIVSQQVLTLTIADAFYFTGEAMIVCLVLIALLRAMPLALPKQG